MSANFDQEIRDSLEQAMKGADSWFAIYDALRSLVPEGSEERYQPLVWAFAFDLLGPEEVERREREGSAFGAMIELGDGRRLPPKLAEVPEGTAEAWAEAYEAIEEPRSRSRLGDLLWEAHVEPRPDLKARSAVEALVELSEAEDWEPMESTNGLVRALELSQRLSDQQLAQQVIMRMGSVIREEMAVEEERPGIPFTLLRALVDLPESRRPEDLGELIGLCEERYGQDAFQLDTAIDLRTQLVQPDERRELRQRQVELWRKRAADADGILRLSFLRNALDLARTHGFAIEAEEMRVELAQIAEEDLGLKAISSEIQLSSEEVERYVSSFVDPEDWRKSLQRFALHGPPGGEPEKLDEDVSKQMQDHPFQFLVTKMVLDPDTGIPIYEATDEASHRRAASAQQRMFAMRLWGMFAIQVLLRIEKDCGRPGGEELTEFFATELIDASNAKRIAEALELWWDGKFDQSAHILAPRLEAVIREMARSVGLPIVREPVANRPGRVRGLGEILSGLKGHLATPGWHAYFTSLLTDPLGLNLRNVISHGLRSEIGADDAALMIHVACYLAMLAQSKREPEPGQD
jgi:hypothetical protein